MILRIGTRASKLALAQSRWVKEKIEREHPHIQVELVRIRTTGDKILDSPLSKIGGKGLFVKEIDEALIDKRVDLAVHSMKDVPAELPGPLTISVFPEREEACDALVSRAHHTLDGLPRGSKVGTSSPRRRAQLQHLRPDLSLVPLRGNVDTRLRKLKSEGLQAIVLAKAGLKRLGLEGQVTQSISPRQIMPAIAQGALGLEVRRDDARTINLVEFLNDKTTEVAVRAERGFLKELGGGCQVPIAAFAFLKGEEVHLGGMVANSEGTRLIKDEITGEKDRAEEIGIELARSLLDSGGREILWSVYGKE